MLARTKILAMSTAVSYQGPSCFPIFQTKCCSTGIERILQKCQQLSSKPAYLTMCTILNAVRDADNPVVPRSSMARSSFPLILGIRLRDFRVSTTSHVKKFEAFKNTGDYFWGKDPESTPQQKSRLQRGKHLGEERLRKVTYIRIRLACIFLLAFRITLLVAGLHGSSPFFCSLRWRGKTGDPTGFKSIHLASE